MQDANESVFLEDEEAQQLLFANFDSQAESCRECLEGEQNYQEIDCEMPEPSIRIKLNKEKEKRLKKREEEIKLQEIARKAAQNCVFRHHPKCREGKNDKSAIRIVGQEKNFKCVTQ